MGGLAQRWARASQALPTLPRPLGEEEQGHKFKAEASAVPRLQQPGKSR